MTSAGVEIVAKLRPIDRLCQSLLSKNPQEINSFYVNYGAIELCSMCISISCGIVQNIPNILQSDSNLRNLATRVLMVRLIATKKREKSNDQSLLFLFCRIMLVVLKFEFDKVLHKQWILIEDFKVRYWQFALKNNLITLLYC
jgi:hypothetical protein